MTARVAASVALNCGACGEYVAAIIPAAFTSGTVACRACGDDVDVAHAYAHAPWCRACGDDFGDCACDGGAMT